jgi:hypothetical protein
MGGTVTALAAVDRNHLEARTLPPPGEAVHGQPFLLVRRRSSTKGRWSKPIERRHWALSFVVGTLVALLIAVGMFLLLVSHQQ